MKRAVSISIGSSKRNKAVEIELLGEKVHIERIGTDGDMQKAAHLYEELDGKVDAFGFGGADLGLMVGKQWYPLYSVHHLVKNVHHTPIADGTGLKITLEQQAAQVVEEEIGQNIPIKRALAATAVDRWGMASGFLTAGYEMVFGDLFFSLGIPIALHSQTGLQRLAKVLMPIAGRLPFEWVYPVGEAQEKRTPKWEGYFEWASVVLGDCHYIRRYMPNHIPGKVIVTNTTTVEDKEIFRQAGAKYLVTTTPVLDGRSFGTNMMEAAILAASGRKTPIDYANPGDYFEWLGKIVRDLAMRPQIQEL